MINGLIKRYEDYLKEHWTPDGKKIATMYVIVDAEGNSVCNPFDLSEGTPIPLDVSPDQRLSELVMVEA